MGIGDAAVSNLQNIPRWREVADALTTGIRSGVYGVGAQLPTENDLAKHFRLNRHTVRRALEHLAASGFVRTERGRGSFVCEEVLEYRIDSRPTFTGWMQESNRVAVRKRLTLCQVTLDDIHDREIVSEVFGDRQNFIYLETVSFATDRPISYSKHIFDPSLHEDLMTAIASFDTLTSALSSLGIESFRQRTGVSARLSDTREATLLRVTPGEPLLCTIGYNVTRDGRPIEISFSHHPASRMKLMFEREASMDIH